MRTLCLLAWCGACTGNLLMAQSAPASSQAKPPAFASASIKAYKASGPYITNWKVTRNGFSATQTAENLIKMAFGIPMLDEVAGLPEWAHATPYVVAATIDAGTSAALQKLPRQYQAVTIHKMIQTLLTQRFQLKFHRETKQMAVFRLVVGQRGAKLKDSQSREAKFSMHAGQLAGTGMGMSNLVESLSPVVGRVVLDKTGLKGKYDVTLTWPAKEQSASSGTEPAIFTALEQQLGLKLEPGKGPVDTIVIDHMEKPAEN